MKLFTEYCRFALSISLLSVLLAGCPSSDATRYARPKFNLLDSVNSEADDIAPFVDDGSLYFTSTREGDEDIWRSAMRGDNLTAKFAAATKDSGDFSELLSQTATNDGTIAFLTRDIGFFASGHAFDSIFASRFHAKVGGSVGGTDLFGFERSNGKFTVENLRALNSPFWDAHPTVAQREDTLLIIFSSDRPDPLGASSPFKNQKAINSKGDTVEGNTDLYYTFRINGKWNSPRNIMTIPGGVAINSSRFEYSPFIYCIDQRPTLLFASDRSGDMDIYQADLEVNFGKQILSVKNCAPLSIGRDSINMTSANERFPFVPYPHGGNGSQPLYIASDRYAEAVPATDGRMMKSFGGYDLYRFELPTQCRAPLVQYRVVVIDGENPGRPVKSPTVSLARNGGETITSTENPAVFNLEWGKKYSAAGGSLWDKIECDPAQLELGRTISHYASMNIAPAAPSIVQSDVVVKRKKMIGGVKTIITDTTLSSDTVTCGNIGEISAKHDQTIRSVEFSNGYITINRVFINRREEITGAHSLLESVREIKYDSIPRFDTMFTKVSERLIPSKLSAIGLFPSTIPANDTIITDTIIAYPQYYQYPLCEWVFTREFKDYRKNVPYFQTGFWEVNTAKNLKHHLEMLADDDAFKNASFIELHPANQYFGTRPGMKADQKEGRKARRERRKTEYRRFADTVDRNMQKMAEAITNDILPSFIELDAKSPEYNNKLIVQIAAYSDARAIKRGNYCSNEKIAYISGHYDEERKEINTKEAIITPGESLIGANNDVLSKLRAWFGYKELLELLRKNTLFAEMLKKGEIILPQDQTVADYRRKFENAKVIIVIEGRQVDSERKAKVQGYAGEDNDYYSLDDVRRIDVQINRTQWQNGAILNPPCCVHNAN